jgi:hypothetical protein
MPFDAEWNRKLVLGVIDRITDGMAFDELVIAEARIAELQGRKLTKDDIKRLRRQWPAGRRQQGAA